MSHLNEPYTNLVRKDLYDQVFHDYLALLAERKIQEARLQSDEVVFKQQEGLISILESENEKLKKDNALVVAVIRENTKLKELLLKTEKLFIRGGRSEYYFLKYKEEAGL